MATSGDYLRVWRVGDSETRLECLLNNVSWVHFISPNRNINSSNVHVECVYIKTKKVLLHLFGAETMFLFDVCDHDLTIMTDCVCVCACMYHWSCLYVCVLILVFYFLFFRTKIQTFVPPWHPLTGMKWIRICSARPPSTQLAPSGGWRWDEFCSLVSVDFLLPIYACHHKDLCSQNDVVNHTHMPTVW